jgi:predicted nuclease of restriction endonuclease-like (RecB) superfamily
MAKKKAVKVGEIASSGLADDYAGLVSGIGALLDDARRSAARAVNAVLTAAYWEIGRRIVEHEQGGKARAGYGEAVLTRLAADLTKSHGRGFSARNLRLMRAFHLGWEIWQTPSAKFQARVKENLKADSAKGTGGPVVVPTSGGQDLPGLFPLPWSHYVRLMTVRSDHARAFYEEEAIRGGWSVRQLDRQISTQFYERLAASRRKDLMLEKGQEPKPEDAVTADEEIRCPYVLEFLGLKDEYSESDLEEALIRHLEAFLLELGAGFTFVARQKRIRVDDVWYRMDLVLYHRRLRSLVIVDLKVGRFTHADAGQMNLYLNYAKEHLVEPGENEPIGIILCSEKSDTVVRYATGGINAQVFAAQYLTSLPDVESLRREIENTRRAITLQHPPKVE